MTIAIRLERCAFTHRDGTRALHPTDLAILPGETLALLGPSGCGKTTCLRLIAGLARPDPGGRVFFDDAEVTDLPIEHRRVGMVFQSYALFPNLDVAGNVGYGLRVRGVPAHEREREVRALLAMMRIPDLAHRRIDQLSGGQRQRVALARALAIRPRALLLDEPLTALDAKLREVLRMELAAMLRRLAITTVIVTHDQAEAMALGDRVAVMQEGRVEQVAEPQDVYERPATRFVAEFVGTLNLLEGTVVRGLLHLPGGRVPVPHAVDGPVQLGFRPEHLQPHPEGPLEGRIGQVLFLGDRLRLLVEDLAPTGVVVETTARGFVVGERRRFAFTADAPFPIPSSG